MHKSLRYAANNLLKKLINVVCADVLAFVSASFHFSIEHVIIQSKYKKCIKMMIKNKLTGKNNL